MQFYTQNFEHPSVLVKFRCFIRCLSISHSIALQIVYEKTCLNKWRYLTTDDPAMPPCTHAGKGCLLLLTLASIETRGREAVDLYVTSISYVFCENNISFHIKIWCLLYLINAKLNFVKWRKLKNFKTLGMDVRKNVLLSLTPSPERL